MTKKKSLSKLFLSPYYRMMIYMKLYLMVLTGGFTSLHLGSPPRWKRVLLFCGIRALDEYNRKSNPLIDSYFSTIINRF
jgi:hypothetical protein